MNKITIEINGEEKELLFTSFAICSCEEKFSGNLSSLLNEGSYRSIAILFWGALLHQNKRLKFEEVLEWIPTSMSEPLFIEIMNKTHEAVVQSQGGGKKKKEAQKTTT